MLNDAHALLTPPREMYLHQHIHIYIYTNIHTHTCIYTYLHSYIHTCIHTYTHEKKSYIHTNIISPCLIRFHSIETPPSHSHPPPPKHTHTQWFHIPPFPCTWQIYSVISLYGSTCPQNKPATWYDFNTRPHCANTTVANIMKFGFAYTGWCTPTKSIHSGSQGSFSKRDHVITTCFDVGSGDDVNTCD